MEVNSAIIEVKALDSGHVSDDEIGKAEKAPAGVGVYLPHVFGIPVGPDTSLVSAHVTTPTGIRDDVKIDHNRMGHVTMNYQPRETGLHILHVYYNDKKIKGSPYQFYAHPQNSKYVHAFGPGLSHGIIHRPAEFTVVTKAAGAGGVCIAIEGPSKAKIECVDNEDGSCSVTYVPTRPGEYTIMVKMGEKSIPGSPFTAKISDGHPIRNAAEIPSISGGNFSLQYEGIQNMDVDDLHAVVESPSGNDYPCELRLLPNGHLGFSFTPEEVGQHEVSVRKSGNHIQNSPFKIYIEKTELGRGHANKVKVHGDGIVEGVSGVQNEFIIDTREAGYGQLGLAMDGPRRSKVNMDLIDNEDGTCKAVYKPKTPGNYVIMVTYGGQHIPGSPFDIIVEEPAEPMPERSFRSASKQGQDLWL
ncbi:filamin-C-like isoform X2 [Ruditapes philippinarum]|uniref:filamin-C-like isoform X2 n=1 Tax=Ruditapes philippinarum TaxID=129788 RepID=UPI00295BC792|nr:filamin-C-like isoform X2 [Ruditapes philippinarum]